MSQHFLQSSYREKLIEHLFIGELLKYSWLRRDCALAIAKPEVDNGGYDVIAEEAQVARHIQLKAAHHKAAARSQKVHIGLADKPAGCIVWIMFDESTLQLGPYLFFGGGPGEKLDISGLHTARHTKPNSEGVKAERPNLRVVPKARFRTYATLDELYRMLFGNVTHYTNA